MSKDRKTQCDVTYEELARYSAGEATAERARELDEHVRSCSVCARRLAALRQVDAVLPVLRREEPSVRAVFEARRALSAELRGSGGPEVMTLEEVAEFLRVSMEEMERMAGELPAFELAGRIRVRRARLLEWVEERERGYMRTSIESEAARLIAGVFGEE